MKLTVKEFEQQLALVKALPADKRAAALANLKTASVVEVDDKGVETAVTIKIMETDGDDATTQTKDAPATGLDEKAVQKIAKEAAEKALTDATAAGAGKGKRPGNQAGAEKFTIPAEVKRVGTLKSFERKDVNGFAPDERAFRFGMWCLAAKGSDVAKQYCREHGIGLAEQKFSDELIQKLHAENVNVNGGFLVPEEFGTDMIDLREKYGVARKVLKVRPMSGDTRTDPRRTSGLTASFVAEGAAGPESTKTWDQVRLTAKDLMVLTRITNQLNADSVINVGDDLASEISYAFSLKEDQCAFVGDKSVTYGRIAGTTQRLIDVFSTGGGTGLILQSGNAGWTTLVLGDFDGMVGALPQYADTDNACWVCHRAFYYTVIEKLIQAQGGVPAYETREGMRKPVPIFKGYPVIFSQVMQSAYTTLTCPITLGDHALAATLGDRQQTTIAFSEHAYVNGQSVFERNEIAVRGVERMDINVHDVGATGTAGPIVGLVLK